MSDIAAAVAALRHSGDVLADLETQEAALLLDEVRGFIGRHVVFPSSHALTAVTLWAVHTHFVGQFDSTPRLAILSPEKQSGKSRTLEILELLCPGSERLAGTSASYMFRRIAQGDVTVLLDECDATWKRRNGDESAEALRSIVNAGHRKGATVGRVEMQGKKAELARFPVYAPVALAGIGDLPDTILDRAVIVRMRRRAPDEKVSEYRERVTRPEGEKLRDRLTEWVQKFGDVVGDEWPDMPDGVTDRAADVWEPLLMVADLVGDEWAKRAREACVAFVTGSRDDSASVGVRLLGDLRGVFDNADAMWTDTILQKLWPLEESPWGDWYGRQLNARDLTKLLKPYGVRPRDVKLDDTNRKGYRREDLSDPWRRYLPTPSATSAISATALASTVADVAHVADTPAKCRRCGQTLLLVREGRDLCARCEHETTPPGEAGRGATKGTPQW
ncbi:MAG TPA: DUF3631 domain-containing protein [Actinomycetes bacterium]|jgi:Protein of unknown function (DUF3631)|nr:DUF3631 domain-containing protein [Actinomycetes bacterium]